MSTIVLEAEARKDLGKGASRRLRRLENKIPAILYGSDKKPTSIHLQQNKVLKALENESVYSSVLNLDLGGKIEHVILKDLQRHPYKPIILHMDFQRVSEKDVLVKHVPLHCINEGLCQGVKDGGIITHTLTQIEIRCQVKDLPEFIEVDLSKLQLNDVVHLSDIKLPKGVRLTLDAADSSHNLPVISIHLPRVVVEEEIVEEEEEVEEETQMKEEEKSESDKPTPEEEEGTE